VFIQTWTLLPPRWVVSCVLFYVFRKSFFLFSSFGLVLFCFVFLFYTIRTLVSRASFFEFFPQIQVHSVDHYGYLIISHCSPCDRARIELEVG
jgi:hypothetical protein